MSVQPQRADDFPYVRVFIETTGNLDLANVGRFLQRLDTGARKISEQHGWRRPSIEIVSLATGSLDLKIKVAGLRVAQAGLIVSAGALALGIGQYLKQEPAASNSVYALLHADRATTIIVEGGSSTVIINAGDLSAPQYSVSRNIRSSGREADEPARIERLTGPQDGIVHKYGGEDFVELDARPGLFIRIRDERANQDVFLEDSMRYTFDGEARIAATGPSFFVMLKAMRLG